MQQLKSCTTKEKHCTSLVHSPWLLTSFTMVFLPKCTVFSKAVQILWSLYIYFQKAVQLLKSCTTKEKSCTTLVHYPWLLISFTMVFVRKCTVFFQSCGNSVVLIYIYLKSCATIEELYNQRKTLYIFGTLSLALNFLHNRVCTKINSFLQSCTNSVVLIYIFLKSCTTIKKLYNQRKKLYIFGTLSFPLNFIHNGVCTKMYSFSQSCTNSVVSSYVYF